jgi:hypothetical protein
MLDAYIIEELKRRERDEKRDVEHRPELPLPGGEEPPIRQSDEDKPGRSVVIIDYSV